MNKKKQKYIFVRIKTIGNVPIKALFLVNVWLCVDYGRILGRSLGTWK